MNHPAGERRPGLPGGPEALPAHLRQLDGRALIRGARAYFEALVERGFEVILTVDARLVVRYASPAYLRVFGVDPSRQELLAWVHPEDRGVVEAMFAALLEEPGAVRTLDVRILRPDGEVRTLEVTAANRLDEPFVQTIVCNCRDVTDRVEATDRLAYQAIHDSLTGLPNRALFIDRLGQALARAERSELPCAVLFVDLDHFKRVNDSMGHDAGDRLLVAVAERIGDSLRPGDSVARLGGDEFAVLAEDIPSAEVALRLAEQVRAAVSQPLRLGERTVNVGCSVGIALSRRHQPDGLLQEADIALYRAKEEGRGRWELFDHAMRAVVQRRLDTEEQIRTALHGDGLVVVYQPVIDLNDRSTSGTEALARIVDGNGGFVRPIDFIPVAEESGLILPLGAAVLGKACLQQSGWLAGGNPLHQVAVNISPRQLASGTTLVREVSEALEKADLLAEHLCLEFTESALIDVGGDTRRTIDDLKALGVGLAIDDFGTGWSSLAYLRRFPVDIVKIDRSFIAGLGTNDADTEVVRAVIGLGQALHLITIAEGVETPEQEAMLKDLGCDFAQGYLFGKPLLPDQLEFASAAS